MKCSKCKIEMSINNTRYITEGDTSADDKTKLFVEQDLICRNKQCPNYGAIVETVRSEIKIG